METTEFLHKFFKDDLGKKVKCGLYYTKSFNGCEYLLFHNSRRGPAYGDNGAPYLLAIRDPQGRYLIDQDNIPILRDHITFESIAPCPYTCGYISRIASKYKLDLSLLSIVDTYSRYMGTWTNTVVLYKVDHAFFLSETYPQGRTVEEYLNFTDVKLSDIKYLRLTKVDRCKKITEARAQVVEGKDPKAVFGTNGFLVPDSSFEPFILDETIQLARNKPHLAAYLPEEFITADSFSYKYVVGSGRFSPRNEEEWNYTFDRLLDDGGQWVVDQAKEYRRHLIEWQVAEGIYSTHLRVYLKLKAKGIIAGPSQRWGDSEGNLWVRGNIEIHRTDNPDYQVKLPRASAFLSSCWHKVDS